MCGIAGYVARDGDPASVVTLKAMTDAIAHRGPDGEGAFTEDNVAIGHRRLAIIDLTPAGHQPMVSADNRYVIAYNGEVYNFQELRLELEAKGYWFRSRTDSEVVLYAYAEWGARCVERFNGMFAFCVWDRKTKQMFLARDRYGIKPLYYTSRDGHFIFGSEVKAIVRHPAYQAEVDREALLEYFTFQNFFTDHTLFKDVRLMPAGCHMVVNTAQSVEPRVERYWDYDFREPEKALAHEEYVEELDRLFRQAVNRQLVSDVDVGSYLSGGMDSGAITALASKQLPYLKTFTCGFDLHSASGLELSFDERETAEFMSYLFRTEHYEMVLKAGDMERVLPKLALHLEEPRVGQSYPNFYVAQLASKFVKVVLSGAGGDELFGGYPWRYYRAVVNDDFEHYIDKYYLYWQRLIDTRHIKDVFQPIWKDVEHVWTRDIFRDVFHHHSPELTRPEDYVNHSLYFEAKTFLSGLLVVEDKLSMAHSLETRVPFLDNDLVDFAMRVPVRHKLGNLRDVMRINENDPAKEQKFFNKTQDGKLLLRKMMERHIPREITAGVKQGFSSPDASWFKGESIEFVKRVINDRRALIYDFLDCDAVTKLVNEHLEGRENRRLLIWSLLNVEQFLRTFMK
jgi:asparagine synthase (glutamine-hydrolysing)